MLWLWWYLKGATIQGGKDRTKRENAYLVYKEEEAEAEK